MAPGLEEEVVFQLMEDIKSKDMEGISDREYLMLRVEELKNLGFKVDDKKVETALKRYELLQAYNSQDNSRRTRRKRIKDFFNRTCEREIEKLKEDPSVISVRVKKYGGRYHCNSCGRDKKSIFNLIHSRLKRNEEAIYTTKEETFFQYCFGCGVRSGYPD